MMSAPVGSTLKVSGISIAMLRLGRRPGGTPTGVPIGTPMKQSPRLLAESGREAEGEI